MNRTFSSKIPKKPSLSLAPAKNEDGNQRRKKQSTSQNQFQDLDAISSCSNSNCSEASSASIEVPRGCLRFFLSHHSSSNSSSPSSNSKSKIPIERPKTLSKTPKSAPNGRFSKLSKSKTSKENNLSKSTVEEKPDRQVSQKAPRFKKNPPCLYQWQSGKKTHSRTAQKSKNFVVLNNCGDSANKLPFGSEGKSLVRMVDDPREATELKPRDADATCTPLTKTSNGSALDCEVGKVVEESSNKSNSKTPPIQASLSPEIQCGSVVSTAITPTCYGAGHIVSGVADKRKCKPRGVLTVGEHDFSFGGVKPFDSFDGDEEENAIGIGDDSTVIHEPTEASMHWLLSPCNEEDEGQKENSEDDGSCRRRRLGGHDIIHSPSSPSTGQGFCSDKGNKGNTESTTNNNRRRDTYLISPNVLPEFEGLSTASSPHATPIWEAITAKESRENFFDLEGKNSPFSMDSLGSGNVMRTPQSESSSGRLVGLSWLNEDSYKKDHFESELNLVAEVLQMTSLSPKSHISIGGSFDSSFQFDCLTTSSRSIDLTQFQKILDDQASWLSNSTLDNVSQSQMRISWRDGLVSRIYEMDDFDCCRCLSDEEEDANGCSDDQLKSCRSPDANVDVASDQTLTINSRSTEFVDNEPRTEGNGKEQFPSQISCPCVESISTDGGGLVASRDSDWTLCYKNHLFEV
ncbi:uncharacterized protein LOC121251002 [Juglans microcarpa x Juglans regia]|uniref:uncharacterized protein LOC121251002 n=1 Tax=Juglans microcarpa x Juglans regia TaxID=2249226 RepID=UPI001B7EA54A|nr:uncharacterized protein LOC121251002 [Juglans microcarpa x Juglans regia]